VELMIDPDVKAVAEFMQANIAAAKLVAVADGLQAIAPLLWGQHDTESVTALRLCAMPLSADRVAHTLQDAKESRLATENAGDGFAAAKS
jgi:hypothetical protein